MQKTVILCCLISMISAGARGQQKEFGWLKGTWKLKDKEIYETWKVAADGKGLEGLSYRIKGTDTVAMEKIRFIHDKDGFHYRPEVPGNAGPVNFRITNHSADSFVAENPTHDFPKLIRYRFFRKDGKDFIDAAIEGDGKVIPYPYERVE